MAAISLAVGCPLPCMGRRETRELYGRIAAIVRREVAEQIAQALEEPPSMTNREITDCAKADGGDVERAAAVGEVYLRYAARVARAYQK